MITGREERGSIALALGLIKRAECHLEEARRVNDADAPASLSIRLAGCEGIWNLSTGRLTTALQKLDSTMRRAQQVADRNYAWWLANYSARAHVFSGAATRGSRLAAFHYDLAVEAQSFTDQAELAATAAYRLLADNNAPDAAKWAKIAVRVTDDNTIWHYRVLALMRLAQVRLHMGEGTRALEAIQAAETQFATQPMSWEFRLELYQTLERVYVHVGDLNAAQSAWQKAFQVDAEICRLDEVT